MLKAQKLSDRTVIITNASNHEQYFRLTRDVFGAATISNTFRDAYQLPADHTQEDVDDFADFELSMDVVESMLLAMFAEGCDLTSAQFLKALQTSMEAIENNIL